jgi:RNA-directed DNA polymerase
MHRFAWTGIVRHQMVKGAASPDDPALADYWIRRRRKAPPPPIGSSSLRLFGAQDGRCPLCGDWLLPADDPAQTPREWEHWLAVARKTTTTVAMRGHGASDEATRRLIHAHYHWRSAAHDSNSTALLRACGP